MIKITNFTKKYGKKVAVDNLTLSVDAGCICGFLGHNGAGKTTTLKALAGILPFRKGELILGGHSMKTAPLEGKKIIAYVPDNPDIYHFFTGIEFLNFVCDGYAMSATDRKDEIERYTSAFDMESVLNDSISTYSHGMKQKLVLISALVHRPKILLLDEPFVGLDPSSSNLLKQFMRELCDNGGAILYSTHVLEVAEQLCDHLAMIKEGKLLLSGKTEDVLANQSLETLFLQENKG